MKWILTLAAILWLSACSSPVIEYREVVPAHSAPSRADLNAGPEDVTFTRVDFY